MKIIIKNSAEEMSLEAAQTIAALIRSKPDAVLGLATGSTPLKVYAELTRMHEEDGLAFSRVTTFNLDEYLGLAPSHPASLHTYMHEHLFKHINADRRRIHIPSGLFELSDLEGIQRHCREYERELVEAGGLDLQLLGIGMNGHVGFNEPGLPLDSRTHLVALEEKTRADNARNFGNNLEKVPGYAITMGIGTILEARMILLLAAGENKAEIIREALQGPVTPAIPASALQSHQNVITILDRDAASFLTRPTK